METRRVTVLVTSALIQPLIAPHLPPEVEAHYFTTTAQALELAPRADIGWFDMHDKPKMAEILRAATKMRWLNTIYAGLDHFPVDALQERHVIVTNGVGINAVAVAEYAVMGMLTLAKRYDEVVRMADRHEWPVASPAQGVLDGSRAMILGYGAIGRLIGDRLRAFGVNVTPVARTARVQEGVISMADWRAALMAQDWLIIAVPATAETVHMVDAAALAAMPKGAHIVNIARGDCIDQDALIAALNAKHIGGAFLDVVTPEPLPPEHPLWDAPNVLHSMHLSGVTQTGMYHRGAVLFSENLTAFLNGAPMRNRVNLQLGY
jgi:phosphoglycerate dehydrogenase-like enzyme